LCRSPRPFFTALATLAVGVLAWSAAAMAAATHGGASRPPALYSNAQAAQGATLYASKCAMCHGTNLEGGAGPPLTGQNMTTLGTKTHLTVGDMYNYIVSNMPMNAPGSLTKDEYVKITAYILKENGYPAGSKAMTDSTASSAKALVRSYK
jgi:polar amino acid transport system substrate-binding protein